MTFHMKGEMSLAQIYPFARSLSEYLSTR
jgi:hypothetical protein